MIKARCRRPTDTTGLYGAIRFIELSRDAGLKPILGTELKHGTHRAVLLAMSSEGYANLCRLISSVHCDADFNLIAAVAESSARADDCV